MRFAILLMMPVAVLAAPVPKTAQFTVKGWGEPTDPLKDCSFDVGKDGKLTLTVPGTAHNLSAQNGKMTAPRVLRDQEGDFKLEVSVDGEWPFDKDCKGYHGAGLFVAQDDKNYIRLEKAQWQQDGKSNCYISFEYWENGEWMRRGGSGDGVLARTKIAHLRLTRQGTTVRAAVSQDGKQWTDLPGLEVKLAAKLKVGVAALHTIDKPFKPVFSDLKLGPLEATKP